MTKISFTPPPFNSDKRFETQYLLQKEGTDSYMICWLDDNNLKPGNRVKLRDIKDDYWYVVKEKYMTMRADIVALNRNPDWFSVDREENIIY